MSIIFLKDSKLWEDIMGSAYRIIQEYNARPYSRNRTARVLLSGFDTSWKVLKN